MNKYGTAVTAAGVMVLVTAGTVEVSSAGVATPVAAPAAGVGVALVGAGTGTATMGALLMSNTSTNVAQGYDRGKKSKSSTRENIKVKDQKPSDKASDQVDGISRTKDLKAKQAPKGQKQSTINKIDKSLQKEKAVQKNLRNIQDIKDNYDD